MSPGVPGLDLGGSCLSDAAAVPGLWVGSCLVPAGLRAGSGFGPYIMSFGLCFLGHEMP